MLKFAIKNIFYSIFVLLGVISVSFALLYVIPGDPVKTMLGERADSITINKVKNELGLNDPVLLQYIRFTGRALTGDFGKSYVSNRDVFKTIIEKFPATAVLSITALVIAGILGIIAGIISALKHNKALDRIIMLFSLTGISVPQFVLGLILILIFASLFPVLPVSGYLSEGGIISLVLPAITLSLRPLAIIARITRAAMLEVLTSDYVRTAKAKGLRKSNIILKQSLLNALNPVITTLSSILAATLGGAFFVEYIFNWHGIGQLAIESIMKLDYPMIQGTVLFAAIIFIFVNNAADILYAATDPKIRVS